MPDYYDPGDVETLVETFEERLTALATQVEVLQRIMAYQHEELVRARAELHGARRLRVALQKIAGTRWPMGPRPLIRTAREVLASTDAGANPGKEGNGNHG